MTQTEYIMKCMIQPPAVVYIDENSSDNEFTIEFQKIPVSYPESANKNRIPHVVSMVEEQAAIYICVEFGDGTTDLCTIEQAAKMTFTTMEGEGFRMFWSDSNRCFIVRVPEGFTFPKEYRAVFRSNGFYTQAKAGTATFKAYLMQFSDVSTEVVTADLYKRYPIQFEYFKADKETVELDEKAVLSWKVRNASKCYLQGIGQVDIEGSKSVTITEPTTFYLSAENDMGKTEWCQLNVGCQRPEIQFEADKEYFFPGEEVALSWKATSSYLVEIQPLPGKVSKEGKVAIKPQFEQIYTATAYGYDHQLRDSAMATISLKTTPWRREGTVRGIGFISDNINVDRRIWCYKGSYYALVGMILFESADLLEWKELSPLNLEEGMSIKHASTIVVEDTFFVTGIVKADTDFIYRAIYSFQSKTWEFTELMSIASNEGGRLAKLEGKPYYAKQKNQNISFYTQSNSVMDLWGLQFIRETDQLIEQSDVITMKERLYTAVRTSGTSEILFYSYVPGEDQWRNEGSYKAAEPGWFCMAATQAAIYLFTKNRTVDISRFQNVSAFQPSLKEDYLPWTGVCDDSPFLIQQDGEVWKLEKI